MPSSTADGSSTVPGTTWVPTSSPRSTSSAPTSGAPYVDARLHLSDCSRHVTLDFSAYDRREAENALRKVAVLRAVLDELEAGLARGLADADLTPRR